MACAVATLAGCTLLKPMAPLDQPVRDEQGTIIEINPSTDPFTLVVGDCLDPGSVDGPVSTVSTVPCTQPHEAQVYASLPLGGSRLPDSSALSELAAEFCIAELEALVGTDYLTTPYDYRFLAPSAESWAADDRELLCLVVDPRGLLTTPLLAGG